MGKNDNNDEKSKSGAPVYRHKLPEKKFDVAYGDEKTINLITKHIEKHIGKVDFVFHEMVSDIVHVDIHMVHPTKKRNYYTLITSGMSNLPMTTPEQYSDYQFAELLICLPPEWKMSEDAFKNEKNYWPVRMLKFLARFPHMYKTWLAWGHSIPNGNPPSPFHESAGFDCALLLRPFLFDEEFFQLLINNDKIINFYSLIPIYEEETKFKLDQGVEELIDRFEKYKITELLDINRMNVCEKLQ